MKKTLSIIVTIIIVTSCSALAFAHPGRLDSNGGHYNRDTGKYHYHHGYPEHQHTNGKCPYDFKDNITERSYYSKKTKKIKQSTASKVFEVFVCIVLSIIMILIIFFQVFR